MKRERGFISLELVKAVAEEASNLGVKKVYLHGYGEPTLHPEFHRLIREFSSKGILVEFSTNLIPITEEKASRIAESGPSKVIASIDTLDEKIYPLLRRGGSVEQALRGLENLLDAREKKGATFRVEAQAVLTELNYFTIYTTFERLMKMGVDSFIVKNFDTFAGAIDSIEFVNQGGSIRSVRLHPYRRRKICRTLLRGDVVVLWDGRLTPCCRDWEGFLTVGRYPGVLLKQVFKTSRFLKLFEAHLKGEFDKFPLCAGCNEWFY